MTRIEGFWIYWGSEHYVWAEREAAPKHKYRFEVSATKGVNADRV